MRVVTGISFPEPMLKALDALVLERRKHSFVPNASRSGIVQELVARHLADSSATVAQKKKEHSNA